MQLIMPSFDQTQILVVGDVILDRYWHGAASHISPEAPVPVFKVGQEDDRPGGAGNVSLNIAALGAGASLIGVVGDDSAGQELSRRLSAAGINTELQISPDKPTITKLRVISRHQQVIRMDFEEPFERADSSEFLAKATRLMPKVNVLVLSDYAKGSLYDCQALIALARRHRVPVLVDPKGNDFTRYRGADILTPNLQELEQIVGPCRTEQVLVSKSTALMEELDVSALLITRGEQGMSLLRPNQPELHLPARAREVFDVTGAGDTVIAVLAAAIAAKQSLPQAMALANLAAGLVVAKLGTATVSAPELRRALLHEAGVERGVVTEEQLMLALEDARSRGERVVFTNGCFDIIHAGHVGYLEEARKLGDRLIVAVNDDESTRRLKGVGRPINPIERRMAVLAGLEAVDWVVSFGDDTPERLLELIRPAVLVKGGDYEQDQVVGADIIHAQGGEVRTVRFYDSCSTTGIVNRIRSS